MPALLSVMILACAGDGGEQQPSEPLRIGLLLNLSGESPRAVERQRGFDLAIKHVNEAGGVFGLPVEVVARDSTLDPETAAAVARRMIEEDGIHALVGPSTSANSIVVAERVTGPARIPIISPSATSPLLTDANDSDFFFRTALSDSAQGPVLAAMTSERGFDNVGLIYRDDAWGKGLADSFRDAWTGKIRVVAVEPGQTTYLDKLEQTAADGAQALVVIAFNTEGVIIMREALDSGLYDRFALGDAMVGKEMLDGLDGRLPAGMFGTLAGTPSGLPSTVVWEEAYVAEYGGLPLSAYVKQSYDAAIAIALAAQAAGSLDGASIRDKLRSIAGPPGETVIAGAEGIADALRTLREDGEVDYDGAAVTMDWDDRGDLTRGHIAKWQFTPETGIEDLGVEYFD